MSEPEQPSQEGLVPANSSALAIRSSELVKRGLELIRNDQLKKRQIRVLVGDGDWSSFVPMILQMIGRALNNEREVVAKSTHLAEQLMKYAQDQEFDLCILYLNNILFPIVPWSARRAKVLEFVSQLKHTSRSPVIAVAGVREDVSLGAEAKRAGADYFLWTPFSEPVFSKAVKACLSVELDSAPQVSPELQRLRDQYVAEETVRIVAEEKARAEAEKQRYVPRAVPLEARPGARASTGANHKLRPTTAPERPTSSADGDSAEETTESDIFSSDELRMVDAAEEAKNWAGMLNAAQALTRQFPVHYMAWCRIATAYGYQGKHDEAVTAYQKTIELRPDYPGAWFGLGYAHWSQRKFDQAVAAFQQATELKPDDSGTWHLLGLAYVGQGKYDDAVAAFRQAIRLNPDDSVAWLGLGSAYKRRGKESEALEALDHLRKLDASVASLLADVLSRE